MKRFMFSCLCFMALGINCFAQNPKYIDFSGDSAETNGITLMGAGFGEYPMPDVSFGDIPIDNAFENATDGRGMIIKADPGEGVMIKTSQITTSNCALLRCSVRMNAPHASLCLASVDQSENSFVSTITPANPLSFVNQYQRIADFFLPPSTGFQGIIQVINTSQTEMLTVYIDNFEIIEMAPDRINVAIEDIVGFNSPIPEHTPTPTPTPTQSGFTGETETVQLDLPEGATELVMVKIPAGVFTMGSPADERGRNDDHEWPPHHVTLTKDFLIGQHEITQAQYQAIMDANPSKYNNNPNNPVETVTWYDAAKFCNELSRQKGLTPVYSESPWWETNWLADGYRLPTEAEWEYACRAGTQTRFSYGDALEMADVGEEYNELGDQYMWWRGNNTYNGNISGTKEVGLKKPNSWNLYDMHGNVWEWCNDMYEAPSDRGPVTDPHDAHGDYRVIRGGSWNYNAWMSRSANRFFYKSNTSIAYWGFRVCRSL